MAVAHNLNIAGRLAFGLAYPLKSVGSEFIFIAVSGFGRYFWLPDWLVAASGWLESKQKARPTRGVREQHTGWRG